VEEAADFGAAARTNAEEALAAPRAVAGAGAAKPGGLVVEAEPGALRAGAAAAAGEEACIAVPAAGVAPGALHAEAAVAAGEEACIAVPAAGAALAAPAEEEYRGAAAPARSLDGCGLTAADSAAGSASADRSADTAGQVVERLGAPDWVADRLAEWAFPAADWSAEVLASAAAGNSAEQAGWACPVAGYRDVPGAGHSDEHCLGGLDQVGSLVAGGFPAAGS